MRSLSRFLVARLFLFHSFPPLRFHLEKMHMNNTGKDSFLGDCYRLMCAALAFGTIYQLMDTFLGRSKNNIF